MEELIKALAGVLFLAGTAASVGLWIWILSRGRRLRTTLPATWRRPVPWGGREVVAVFLMHIAAALVVSQLAASLIHRPAVPGPEETTHAAVRLLLSLHNPLAVAWAVVVIVLITPICEEFVYRLVIQGWLESLEGRLRRRWRLLRRVPGLLSIGLSAGLFAFLHARGASPPIDPDVLLLLLTGMALGNLAVLLAAAVLLRAVSGATWTDLGWDRGKLPADVLTGLGGFLAAFAPVFLAQLAALALLPQRIAADPAGIFVLAVVLGWLYLRTHRLVPSIVCHMALNAQTVLWILLLGHDLGA